MKPSAISVQVAQGRVVPDDQRQLSELFAAMKTVDGNYTVTITPGLPLHSLDDYKYYFDCVLGLALPVVAKRFEIIVGKERSNPVNVEELHECLKISYHACVVIDTDTGEVYRTGISTKKMNRSEWRDWIERVVAEFTEMGAYGDTGCPTREEWREMHNCGQWGPYKSEFYEK